jgi:hypothetical protein
MKKQLNLNISFGNKTFYFLAILACLAIVLVFVYASEYNIMGHDYAEIKPCAKGQILVTNDLGTAWECEDFSMGGDGYVCNESTGNSSVTENAREIKYIVPFPQNINCSGDMGCVIRMVWSGKHNFVKVTDFYQDPTNSNAWDSESRSGTNGNNVPEVIFRKVGISLWDDCKTGGDGNSATALCLKDRSIKYKAKIYFCYYPEE